MITQKSHIAHIRKHDSAIQDVASHLRETAELCSTLTDVLSIPVAGRLLGLLHDFGKYSKAFQQYIREITGALGEEAQAYAEAHKQGTIDHATAGAQYLHRSTSSPNVTTKLANQILIAAILSHHSRTGIHDFIDLTGYSKFAERISKPDVNTHLSESTEQADKSIVAEIDNILNDPDLYKQFTPILTEVIKSSGSGLRQQFQLALLTRFVFSCLLDADRLSTIDFENPKSATYRSQNTTPDWQKHVGKLEEKISTFSTESKINQIRADISSHCKNAATNPNRILTLPVPTGGGKTLASLRFALHRALLNPTQIKRIFYILPYTSIIDQNAEEIREIIGKEHVLEHHSNLSPEKDNWRNRSLSENWDAPIVFTTTVQFLNSFFAQGTKTARRMHQLSESIIIFDEIQNLPIKTIHLFNNAIHFLTQHCGSTALLCTATMPLLDKVDAEKGALPQLDQETSIIPNKNQLFKALKRTEIIDKTTTSGWSNQEIIHHTQLLQQQYQSVLIITNTKQSAHDLYQLAKDTTDIPVVHLSTHMCPAHRKDRIAHIRRKLDPQNPKPILCISTQLIEAGVDLDFGAVIRSLAGLDSIIQAAGRCNRHGHRAEGPVHIINFGEEEVPAALAAIKLGQETTQRILNEYKAEPVRFDHDLLSEKALNQYYHYTFHKQAAEMSYPLSPNKNANQQPEIPQQTSILDLLSLNTASINAAENHSNPSQNTQGGLELPLKQAHSTAAQSFRVIDAPTIGIIVPYQDHQDKDQRTRDGAAIIGELAASYANEDITLAQQVRLHKQTQQYTVNIFPHTLEKLKAINAIRPIQPDTDIYQLDDRHYHTDLGITLEALSDQQFYHA